MMSVVKVGCYLAGAVLFMDYLWKMFERYKNTASPIRSIDEVRFANNRSNCCRTINKSCKNQYCMGKLFDIYICNIDSAKSIICIAIYMFTCKQIHEAIVRAHRRGVIVRIIVDQSMYHSTKSKAIEMLEVGIAVRSAANEQSLMHHKFCLIDVTINEASHIKNQHPTNGLVITGSMNWTWNAFNGNWENVLVLSDEKLKNAFKNEFDDMWRELGVNSM